MTNDSPDFKVLIGAASGYEKLFQVYPTREEAKGHFPYDEMGIRIIGGKSKITGRMTPQSLRFSSESKYSWDDNSVKLWCKEHGYGDNVNISIVDRVNAKLIDKVSKDIGIYKTKVCSISSIINKSSWKEGQPLLIEGIITSDSIDSHGEVVEVEATMESVPWYMKFPTVRYMHQADPIGKTLEIWREGNRVLAKMFISASAVVVIKRILEGIIKAFSIGFFWLEGSWKDHDTEGGKLKVWHFTKIRLVEVSPVDSPANRDAEITSAKPVGEDDKKLEVDPSKLVATSLHDVAIDTTIRNDLNLLSSDSTNSSPSFEIKSLKGGVQTPEEEPEVIEEEVPEEVPAEVVPAESAETPAEIPATEEPKEQEPAKIYSEQDFNVKVQEATQPLDERIAELENKVKDLEVQLAAKESTIKELENTPAVRVSMGMEPTKEVNSKGVPLDTSEADEKMARVLKRVAGYKA